MQGGTSSVQNAKGWILMILLKVTRAIGTKWGFMVYQMDFKSAFTVMGKLKRRSQQKKNDLEKPLVQDGDAADVDEHLYRSMIGSLMYLTASRPDIMFAVCACARFQVSPKSSHLLAVKRIFRYLKGNPIISHLGILLDSYIEN
ncbi:hypothetical protein Tco_0769595 [Tanacetum coccineum]|uniref:Reverse transcriptase Ty1/copia-type domain-containing protein n=1 Tax=Tanacetum coccineum TaxID=301880 RepID=A0ABQ4Z9U5_9ASTR